VKDKREEKGRYEGKRGKRKGNGGGEREKGQEEGKGYRGSPVIQMNFLKGNC
jgi:hypothetical protein